MPVLAAALAARFPHDSARITRLRGLARAPPTAGFAHQRRQGDSRHQLDRESRGSKFLDRAMVSLPVRDLSLVTSTSKGILAMKRRAQIWLPALLMLAVGNPVLAQVSKVTADAKGIT